MAFVHPFFVPLQPEKNQTMALRDTMESTGSKLFKYRGQIPVLIFLCAIPILFVSNSNLYSYILSDNTPVICAAVVSLLFIVAGLALRAYTVCTTPKGTSGRNTKGQVANVLNTKGIYSVVRHPLYLANYLIWAGLLVYTLNIFAFLIVSLVYWIYYERIMLAEESFLRQKFGEQFEEWSRKVPAFVPRLSGFEPGMLQFSFKTFIRREYATLMSTIVSFTVIDYLVQYLIHRPDFSFTPRISFWVTVVYTCIAVIIKIIKHRTHLLDADSSRD